MRIQCAFASVFVALTASTTQAQTGYSPPVRIPTPVTGRCINSTSDEVTVTLRRLVTQKYGGFFTQDNKAGVTVVATLNGTVDASAKTPSVNQVDVQQMKTGQVSLALEYAVADQLILSQENARTKNIQLDLFMARTRGKNTFGTVIDVAAQVLSKLPIPANPYTTGASKFLQFANQAIQSQTGAQDAIQVASLTLAFNDQDESDVHACLNQGFQPTGALAVFSDKGASDSTLLPISNLSQQYCFRYASNFTYELQYVTKPASAGCETPSEAAWHEVPNDYVMLIVAAQKVPSAKSTTFSALSVEDRERWSAQRRQDIQESTKLCKALRMPVRNCGVR